MNNISRAVKQVLANSGGRFKGRQASTGGDFEEGIRLAGLTPSQVVKAVLLRSDKHLLMAVLRADQILDLAHLAARFKRDFVLCNDAEVQALIGEGEPALLAPLPQAYGIKAIIDESVDVMEMVYFAVGVPGLFIQSSPEDFVRLHTSSLRGHRIAEPPQVVASIEPQSGVDELRRQVQQVNRLPAMPGLAMELLRIRHNPYAHASELSAVIEQDPSLTAQLIRYASSPLYAYQGKIESVEQAIVRVLGMDFVQDIAFGLALGKAFNNPRGGEFGLDQFWRHALYCASLTQSLCEAIDFQRRPSPGLAYLSGLLHNFGLLLLGHLFPAHLQRLQKAREKYPLMPLQALEHKLFGVTHNEMGLWLMDAWDMPREVSNAVSGHHDPDLSGDFTIFANLVYIANALLKRHGIGDSAVTEVPQALLDRVGLGVEQLEASLGAVLMGRENLELMARKMAA